MATTETILFTTIVTEPSASWTKPAGVKKLLVECWGPGGGGGLVGSPNGGCGGGGGGYARSVLYYPAGERNIAYKVPRGGNPDERWAFYTWWDDTGPSTTVGELPSSTFTVNFKVGGSGGMGSPSVSADAFGRTGGGVVTGGIIWPNLTGSVDIENYGYRGGDGARSSGASAGGGGGAAGPNGNGQSLVTSVYSPTGGTGSGDFAGNGGNGGQDGFPYGGGGGGYSWSTGDGGPGGQGLIRLTVFYDELIPASIEWNGNTLLMQYPFDNTNAYSTVIDGSETVRIENGFEYSWIPNTNYILEADVRWIPTTSTSTQTGWDGATGWRAFLEYARAKNQFKFYPDARNPDYYINSYLVEPLNGEHELESDGTRRFRLVIRNTTTAYEGF